MQNWGDSPQRQLGTGSCSGHSSGMAGGCKRTFESPPGGAEASWSGSLLPAGVGAVLMETTDGSFGFTSACEAGRRLGIC